MKRLSLLFLTLFTLVGSMTITAADFATGVVRLRSNRTSWYLTSASKGTATTAERNLNTLNQVWILLPSGEGYSLRNANSGEYLQASYTATGAGKVTLYIRKSPNATASKEMYNISSDSGFDGKFLNTNTSHNLFSYSFDDGCDWFIEAVENYSQDEIRDRILGMSPYAGEVKEGAYYRIVSYYGLAMTASEQISTKNTDPANFSQYWQLKKSGSGWNIQSVVSDKYVQRQSAMSTPFEMGTSPVAFNISKVKDDWDYRWTIHVGSENAGLHDASSQGHSVVRWSTNAAASEWYFEEVELSADDIAAARAAEASFNDLVANKAKLQAALDALFEDKACTTLKSDVQALSDEALAANTDFQALTDDMKAMVLKVKNDTWQQFTDKSTGYTAGYEKFFRIADYHIYSNCDAMANGNNFTMSNAFGRLSGPTGIVANAGDIVCVYVGSNAPSGCTLQLEAVSTDGVPGNHPSGATTDLKAGLNLFRFAEQKVLYVFYQLNDTKKYLKDYPDVTVHFEGGQLQGYWDATRGMTNADWKLLQQDLLKASNFLNLKTKHLVFQMHKDLVTAAEPKEMEGLMRIWDRIVENEDRYMGVEDFEGRYNNIWNAFSGASSYMHSTTRGTWYDESTIPTVMNYQKMSTGGGNLWGPSHEIGHNHQGSINVIGTTESSNNLFSNINTFESGILNSRRYYPSQNFDYMVSETPWLERNIWMTTGMFFQLYLYFHVQGHDPNFYPNLFRIMRQKPINKWSGPGTPTSYGKDDYLHLAKMMCDAAQADLSEFFEAYGMFIPVNKLAVGDYANYTVTTTQSHINSAKKYMQKYEKKLGNIMFIDDRIIQKEADPENIFGCVPASDGKKRANDEYPYLMKTAKSTYVGGDYESFTDDAEPVVDDYYTLNRTGKTITFQGTPNYAGHKFYDKDGNLIWATNAKSATLPENVLALGLENVTIMTAMYDMTDRLCTTEKPGDAVNDLRMGEVPATKQVFDLTGRRVNSIKQSGLYIVNGKKVLVK